MTAYQITVISLYQPCPALYHYRSLTLLSLSSSVFNHSKSLYLLLTRESFSLKMGRFVWTKKKKRIREKKLNKTGTGINIFLTQLFEHVYFWKVSGKPAKQPQAIVTSMLVEVK